MGHKHLKVSEVSRTRHVSPVEQVLSPLSHWLLPRYVCDYCTSVGFNTVLVIDVVHRHQSWVSLLVASFGNLHAPSGTMKASLKGGGIQARSSPGASGLFLQCLQQQGLIYLWGLGGTKGNSNRLCVWEADTINFNRVAHYFRCTYLSMVIRHAILGPGARQHTMAEAHSRRSHFSSRPVCRGVPCSRC